jgi:hypothetical protein
MHPENCLNNCKYAVFLWEPDFFGTQRGFPSRINCTERDGTEIRLTSQQIAQVLNRGCGRYCENKQGKECEKHG